MKKELVIISIIFLLIFCTFANGFSSVVFNSNNRFTDIANNDENLNISEKILNDKIDKNYEEESCCKSNIILDEKIFMPPYELVYENGEVTGIGATYLFGSDKNIGRIRIRTQAIASFGDNEYMSGDSSAYAAFGVLIKPTADVDLKNIEIKGNWKFGYICTDYGFQQKVRIFCQIEELDSILLHKTFYDFMRSNEGREEYSEEFNYRFSPSNIIKLKKDHVYEIWFGVWFYSWCQGQSKDGSALLIMNNDPTSLFLDLDSITVKHSDIKPPEIVWWEGSGNFGTVKKDTTVTKSFTLKNIGTLPATGEVYRTGSGNFQITQGGGDFSLDGGETKTIKVKFTPTSRGVSYSGELIARGYNYQNAEMDLYGVCSNSKVKNNEIRFQSYLESWIESLIERFPSLEFFTSFFYQNYNVCSDMNIGYPDLIMTSFRTEPVIVDGYIIPGVREVLFDIKNDGDVSANLPNNLKIVKMININFGYDNDFYIWTGLYGPPIELKPGDSLTLSSSSNWHGGVPIGSKLKFILDPENKIDEGPEGEDNNHVSYKIPLVKNTNLFQKWLT